MWLLTHMGDLTNGKRLWLRPGSAHLLGRTRNDKSAFNLYVDAHKTISRKHLVIEVRAAAAAAAAAAAVARPDVRSEVVLRDDSKFGTELDGERFTKGERVVGGSGDARDVHVVRLGKWEVEWRLEWWPVVVAVSGGGRDGVAGVQRRLGGFDVKVCPEYVPGRTTHVVASKRNTPRVLQALVEGRFVVSEGFVDALEERARKRDAVVDEEGVEEVPKALLEEDFDGNWPREADFVPPAGSEPVKRPGKSFAPDQERENVFAGYTFVFCDQNQFDQLAPAITGGRGKALFRGIDHDSGDIEGFIRYVKNVAGEKGVGEFEDGSEGNGVVVVRITDPLAGKNVEWWQKFYNSVDLGLGQRSINQNEFLDAIVTKDASKLRQPLQEEDVIPSSIPGPPPSTSVGPSQMSVVTSREGQTQAGQSQVAPPPSSEPPMPRTMRKGFRRALTESRFKGFDDFKAEELPKTRYVSDDDDDEEMQETAPSQTEPTQMSIVQSQGRVTRGTKRQHEQQAIEISDDEELFPAAAVMKRRKLEQQLEDPAMEDIPEATASPAKPKKPSLVLPSAIRKAKGEKEVNVREVARERRDMEEKARWRDEESLREALRGMDIEEMKNLAKIEVMEIRPRSDKPGNNGEENGDEERWKPEWNGRKNFKKFRKRRPGDKDGDARAPLRGRKVIVGLEEVKCRDFTTTDAYLLEDNSTFDSILSRLRQSKFSSHSNRSTRPGSVRTQPDSDSDHGSFRRTGRHSAQTSQHRSGEDTGPASAIAIHPDDDGMRDLDPEEIAGQPRSEAIASMVRDTGPSSARPGTASSTRSRGTSIATRGMRASPAPSSQTLADEGGTTQQQRPDSRASAISTTITRGKRGAMGPPATVAEPPVKKRRAPPKAKGPPAKLGKGLGRPESEDEDKEGGSGGSGDELKFRRRRR